MLNKDILLDKEAKAKLLQIIASGVCTPNDQSYLTGLFKLKVEVEIVTCESQIRKKDIELY